MGVDHTADDHTRAWALALIDQQPPGSEDGVVDWLSRLCRAASQEVDVIAATVTMGAPGDTSVVVAASAPGDQRFAEFEYAVGEGPANDAWLLRRPVLVPELGGSQDGAWPGYTATATAAGVVAIFAFPLQVGAVRVGVLTLYHDQPGTLSPANLATCLLMAELATERLVDSHASEGEAVDPSLEAAADVRMEIYQAQGMVAVALEISLVDALATLRGHAFQSGRDLIDVASEIVHNGYRLGDDRHDRNHEQDRDQE